MDVLRLERRGTAAIAWITVITGAAQLVMPASLLPLLQVEPTAAASQLFATVGMFMVLFGAAVLHAQAQPAALPVVLLWAGLQKIGAALLVGWAVSRGVFAPLALLIAGFDFASGMLFFDLRRRGG
ncbi:MAG: hypothetical protein M3Y67_09305 [Pseudomonadota bacterium]|nr:hypothetical protein [Pseudomonadota bacterium]